MLSHPDPPSFSIELNVLRSILSRRFAIDASDGQLSPIKGLTGINWKACFSDGVTYWLRPQTAEKSQLGIDRRREARLLNYLFAYGLSPRSFGVMEGWLITEWLPGEVMTSDSGWLDVVKLMVCLHSIPPRGISRDLRRHCAGYWQQLDRRYLSPEVCRWHRYWQSQAAPRPLKRAILHLDVHPGNLIKTPSGIKLIDWEYASVGDIALDLAALCRGYGWDNSEITTFIDHYCQLGGYGEANALSRQVSHWLPFVDYMSWLWYEVRWQQTGQTLFRTLAARQQTKREQGI